MADIFISYKRVDQARIEPLVQALQVQNLTVWWDTDILAGGRWNEIIGDELAAAGCVIVAWSRAASASQWVRDEAGVANDANKLVPVRLDNDPPPMGFRGIQAENFSAWHGDTNAPEFRRLLAAVRSKLAAAQGGSTSGSTGTDRINIEPDLPQPGIRSLPRWLVPAAGVAAIGAVVVFFWLKPGPIPIPTSPIRTQYKIFLHTQRPASDTTLVRDALKNAGYTLAGSDTQIDRPTSLPALSAVDYSTQRNSEQYRMVAVDLATIINKALGTELQARAQSAAPPDFFGVWLPADWSKSAPDSAYCYQRERELSNQGRYLIRCFQSLNLCNDFRATEQQWRTSRCDNVVDLRTQQFSITRNNGPSQLQSWRAGAQKDERSPPTWTAYSEQPFPLPIPQFTP